MCYYIFQTNSTDPRDDGGLPMIFHMVPPSGHIQTFGSRVYPKIMTIKIIIIY